VKINTVVIPNSIIVSVSMGCPISVSVLGLGLGAVKRSSASKLGRRDCLRQPFKLKLVLNVEATWTMNKRRLTKSKLYEIADQIDRIIASRHPPASLRSSGSNFTNFLLN
jgi:hypothetical protein